MLGTGTSSIFTSTSGAVAITMLGTGTSQIKTVVNGSTKSAIQATSKSAIHTAATGLLGQRFEVTATSRINSTVLASLGKTLNLSSTLEVLTSLLGNLEFLGPPQFEPQIIAINNNTFTINQTPIVINNLIQTKIGNIPYLVPTVITLPRTNPGIKAQDNTVVKPAAENIGAEQSIPPKLKPEF